MDSRHSCNVESENFVFLYLYMGLIRLHHAIYLSYVLACSCSQRIFNVVKSYEFFNGTS